MKASKLNNNVIKVAVNIVMIVSTLSDDKTVCEENLSLIEVTIGHAL